MFRNLLTTIASGAVLYTGLLSTVHAAEPAVFTHDAEIPAGTDLSSIRFEKARLVMLPAEMRQTTGSSYCAEVAARGEGESAFCPEMQAQSRAEGWELTFSFVAPAHAWEEGAAGRSDFTVVYRPEELTPAMRNAFPARKPNRRAVAELFAVNAQQETAAVEQVDQTRSSFCAGSFVEGTWTMDDAGCADKLAYTTVRRETGYMNVRVEPSAAVLSARR